MLGANLRAHNVRIGQTCKRDRVRLRAVDATPSAELYFCTGHPCQICVVGDVPSMVFERFDHLEARRSANLVGYREESFVQS